jgi:hypothetical protein
LVIILIIIGIVLFFYWGTPAVLPRWTVTNGPTTGTTASVTSTNGMYYVVNTSDPTLQLTVLPPLVEVVGSEFTIDNSKVGTVVTLVSGSSYTIPPGTTATFVWTTATSARLLSTSK